MIDVRVKFLNLSLLSFLSVVYQNPISLLILFITNVLLLILLKINPIVIIKRLKAVFKLLLVMLILQSVFTSSGTPIIEVFNITILSVEGINRALVFFFRILVIIFSASMLYNNDSREITQGLIQLKIPYEICLMSVMGVKFIPMLKDHFNDTFLAMQLRGIDIKKQKLKDKINIISHMLFPVIASSIHSAREVSISIQLRGFRAYETRTSYYTLQLKNKDKIIIFISIIYFFSFILLNSKGFSYVL